MRSAFLHMAFVSPWTQTWVIQGGGYLDHVPEWYQGEAAIGLPVASTVRKQDPDSLYLVSPLALGVMVNCAWLILRQNIMDLHQASGCRKEWDGRQSRLSGSTDCCCSFFVKQCCYPL